jgi:hypothetical protein
MSQTDELQVAGLFRYREPDMGECEPRKKSPHVDREANLKA